MYIGSLGVAIFFVISGFLITTLCIKEKINTGNLSLKNFYVRRALRILPVAYLYIVIIAILNYFFKLQVTNLIISVFAGFIIVNNISPKTNLIYKFLNLKPLSFIGILSYSIYIWQQLFLSNDARFPLSKYPVNLIFLALIPLLSYFYYEKYFLKLKARFIKNKTA
jgi:peptidoglycan/LPS O-acetylase OafA/YrhL